MKTSGVAVLVIICAQGFNSVRHSVEKVQQCASNRRSGRRQSNVSTASKPSFSHSLAPTNVEATRAHVMVATWRRDAKDALGEAVRESGITLKDMHELTIHYACLYNSFGNCKDGVTEKEYTFKTSYRPRWNLPSEMRAAYKPVRGTYLWNVDEDDELFKREMQCDNQHTLPWNPIHWSPNRVILVSRKMLGALECAIIFLGTKTREHAKNDMNFKRVHEWAGYTRVGGFHRGFVKQMDGYFNSHCFRNMVHRALLGAPRREVDNVLWEARPRCDRIISMGHSLGGSVAELFAAAANGMYEYSTTGTFGDERHEQKWRLDVRGAKQWYTRNKFRRWNDPLEINYTNVFPVEELLAENESYPLENGYPFPHVEIYAQGAPPITFVDESDTLSLENRHPAVENRAFKGLRLNAAKEVATCSDYMDILWKGRAHWATSHKNVLSYFARIVPFVKADQADVVFCDQEGQCPLMSGAYVPILTVPNAKATFDAGLQNISSAKEYREALEGASILDSVWSLFSPEGFEEAREEQLQEAASQIEAHPYDFAVMYTPANGQTMGTINTNQTGSDDNGWQWSKFSRLMPGVLPVASEGVLQQPFGLIHNRYPYARVLEHVAAAFAT